jgi:hypothetical protein
MNFEAFETKGRRALPASAARFGGFLSKVFCGRSPHPIKREA